MSILSNLALLILVLENSFHFKQLLYFTNIDACFTQKLNQMAASLKSLLGPACRALLFKDYVL